MSTLSALDAMVLRETVYPPLTTKAAELTYGEWDQRVIDMYAAIQDIVSGGNVEAYNPATVYDSTSSNPYLNFVGYDSRIWQAVFAGTFSGQTPAEGVYWTQITLAQMLPNVLKLVEVGNGIVSGSKRVKLVVPAVEVNQLFTTPKLFGISCPAGFYIKPVSIQFGIDFNTTQYATNFGVGVRAVGATAPISTHSSALDTNVSRVVEMPLDVYATANQTQYMDGADLELYGLVGNSTLGDSVSTCYISYDEVEL